MDYIPDIEIETPHPRMRQISGGQREAFGKA
jgi:hypothetical protein